jgi:GT2 family glycosyltransferase
MRRAKTRLAPEFNGHGAENAVNPNGNGNGHAHHTALNGGHGRLAELELDLRRQIERVSRLEERLQLLLKDHDKAQLTAEDVRGALAGAGLSEVPRSPYQQLVRRIREIVTHHVPRYSTIIVASKGDPELLNLNGRAGLHFPQNSEGKYAGYYPECSLGAIAQLEALRARGGQYFLLPGSAFWWLDHYPAFKQHLEKRYRLLVRSEETCAIYSLDSSSGSNHSLAGRLADIMNEFQARFGRDPAVLDWRSGVPLAAMLPHQKVFQPFSSDGPLPYLDRSLDLVVTDANDAAAVSEAWRVAMGGVVTLNHACAGGEAKLSIEWFSGVCTDPLKSVSIIIPCYNGRALTDACLRSVFETLPPQFSGEIIVVDDASTDDTQQSLTQWMARDSHLRVLRNSHNLGFVDTCNRGAHEAMGQLLVFLNNDVVLLPGWLPPLLHLFRNFPQAGATGGKLILSDGTLQEAGGSVFCDGSAMNFGRGDTKLDAPLYNFVREVDYCSGALLATPRALFEELGGFDPAYRPGYYEDTDYCFKVRSKGYQVFYQPETAAVHREGGTAGTDVAVGMKRHQVFNQVKFLKRWSSELKHQPVRPKKVDSLTLYALAARNNGENLGNNLP